MAITDNADPMNVVVYRRGADVDGRARGVPVPVFDKGASATDQSLIAAGRAIVVENNYGYRGRGRRPAASTRRRGSSAWTSTATARVPQGVAQRTSARPRRWPSSRSRTGSSTPYTKRPPEDGEDAWYLTALDFRTGKTVYEQR